jgi:hypothetical protein
MKLDASPMERARRDPKRLDLFERREARVRLSDQRLQDLVDARLREAASISESSANRAVQ